MVKIGRFGISKIGVRSFKLKPQIWRHIRVMDWLGCLWWW